MLKNIKIVCFLVSVPKKIYFGIIKADFILGDGKHKEMAKARNMVKALNFALENISIKALSKIAKGKVMDK
jgi:hypothetical protein